MRLATWNCNGAFRRKLDQADNLNADVLIIQECEDPAQSNAAYQDWAGAYAWKGDSKDRGLGIFPRNGQAIEVLDWDDGGTKLFLPVRIDGRATILGVWTQAAKPASRGYIGQFFDYMQLHGGKFGKNTILCGDFNSSPIWDKPKREFNHSSCVEDLASMGFRSLYHDFFGETQGNETHSTFHLYRHLTRPYHIDYVFAHEAAFSAGALKVSIGEPEVWLKFSDHLPLTAEF